MCCPRAGPLVYAAATFLSLCASVAPFVLYCILYWKRKKDGGLYLDASGHDPILDYRVQVGGWLFVFAYQMLARLFCFAMSYRFTPTACAVRGAFSPIVLLLLFATDDAVIAYMVVLDNEYLGYSLIGLGIACAASWGAMLSFCDTFENIHNNLDIQKPCERGVVMITIVAGFAFITSWCACVFIDHVALLIFNNTHLDRTDATYIFLGIILLYLGIWFFLDVLVLCRRTQFVFSVYVSCAVATASIFIKFPDTRLTYILTGALTGLAVFSLLVKLIVNCCCGRKKSRKDDYEKHNVST